MCSSIFTTHCLLISVIICVCIDVTSWVCIGLFTLAINANDLQVIYIMTSWSVLFFHQTAPGFTDVTFRGARRWGIALSASLINIDHRKIYVHNYVRINICLVCLVDRCDDSCWLADVILVSPPVISGSEISSRWWSKVYTATGSLPPELIVVSPNC